MLDGSKRRVRAQGLELEITEAAKKLLVAHRHQPEFGARPLRRTIQTELDNRIASLLLSDEAEPGDTVVADVKNNALVCPIRRPEPGAEAGADAESGAGTGAGTEAAAVASFREKNAREHPLCDGPFRPVWPNTVAGTAPCVAAC